MRFLRDEVFPFYTESPILANWLGIVDSRIDGSTLPPAAQSL
jgi:hypothetical protein